MCRGSKVNHKVMAQRRKMVVILKDDKNERKK